jgi:hypothetical protein
MIKNYSFFLILINNILFSTSLKIGNVDIPFRDIGKVSTLKLFLNSDESFWKNNAKELRDILKTNDSFNALFKSPFFEPLEGYNNDENKIKFVINYLSIKENRCNILSLEQFNDNENNDKNFKDFFIYPIDSVGFAKYLFRDKFWLKTEGINDPFLVNWFKEKPTVQAKFINLPLFSKLKKKTINNRYNINDFISYFQNNTNRTKCLNILSKTENNYTLLNDNNLLDEFNKLFDSSNYFLTIGLPFAAIFALFLIYLFVKKAKH